MFKVIELLLTFNPLREGINKHFGSNMKNRCGPQTASILISATAGSIMGVGEIILLPLDVLKIKAQTNPDQLSGKGAFQILRQVSCTNKICRAKTKLNFLALKEGFQLYKGAGWTAARNAPG